MDREEQRAGAPLHPLVEGALAELGRTDAHAADLARSAWEPLYGDDPPAAVQRHRLQDFLWYDLPRRWFLGVDGHLAVADALARLCTALGLHAHAALCTDSTTADILRAWDRDPDRGFEAFRKAVDRSGLEPPDTPQLAWGALLTADEAAARDHVAAALEAAVDEGRLRPGARGWRTEQRRISLAALDECLPDHPIGQTWLQTVVTARIGDWMERWGAGTRWSRLGAAIEAELLHPVPVPEEAAALTAPLRWLLARAAADDLPLTERGHLARPVVAEGVERFGWEDELFGKAPRREGDLATLPRWHELVRSQRWVRRRGRRLVLADAGQAVLDDVETAWRGLCAGLGATQGFAGAVQEAALLVVLGADDRLTHHTAVVQITSLVAEAGWRDRFGDAPEQATVSTVASPYLYTLQLFGLRGPSSYRAGAESFGLLTPAGRATVVEALRHRAVAPRRGES